LRIKTANTLRAIDNWIVRFRNRNTSFLLGFFALAIGLASSKKTLFAFPGLVIALALYFAAIQLGILILIGFFLSKLYSYKIVNAFFKTRF